MGRKEKKAVRKGKKVRKGRKHESLKQHKYYKAEGGLTRVKKSCPRCGTGTWLAEHKHRLYCGRCAYTEFLKKPEAGVKRKEEKPEATKEAKLEEKKEEKPKEEPKEEKKE